MRGPGLSVAALVVLLLPQFVDGPAIQPIISCDQGVLLGVVEVPGARGTVYLLTDPDLIATHGLRRGDNALAAVRIIEAIRRSGGPVVFEETIHGHTAYPSVWRELFRFPLVLVTLQLALSALVLLWLAMVRFGAPLPAVGRLAAGKRFLIDHMAAVQRLNGHTPDAVRRYYHRTVRLVAQRLNIPPAVEGDALDARIARSESIRRPTVALTDVRQPSQ